MLRKSELSKRLLTIQNSLADLRMAVIVLERSLVDLSREVTARTPQKNPNRNPRNTKKIDKPIEDFIFELSEKDKNFN